MDPRFEQFINRLLLQPGVIRRWLCYPIKRDDPEYSLNRMFSSIIHAKVMFRVYPDSFDILETEHANLRIPLDVLSKEDRYSFDVFRKTCGPLVFNKIEMLGVANKIVFRRFKYDSKFTINRARLIRACCIGVLTAAAQRGVLIAAGVVLGNALQNCGLEKILLHEIRRMMEMIVKLHTPKDVLRLEHQPFQLICDGSSSYSSSSSSSSELKKVPVVKKRQLLPGPISDESSVHQTWPLVSSVQQSFVGSFEDFLTSVQKVGFRQKLTEIENKTRSRKMAVPVCHDCGGGASFFKGAGGFICEERLRAYVRKHGADNPLRTEVLFVAYATNSLLLSEADLPPPLLRALEDFTNDVDIVDGDDIVVPAPKILTARDHLAALLKREITLKPFTGEAAWTDLPITDMNRLFLHEHLQLVGHPAPERAVFAPNGTMRFGGCKSAMVSKPDLIYQLSLSICFFSLHHVGNAFGTYSSLHQLVRWMMEEANPYLTWFSVLNFCAPITYKRRAEALAAGPPKRCRSLNTWRTFLEICNNYLFVPNNQHGITHPTQVALMALKNFVMPNNQSGTYSQPVPLEVVVCLVDVAGEKIKSQKLGGSVEITFCRTGEDVDMYWATLFDRYECQELSATDTLEFMAMMVNKNTRHAPILWNSVFDSPLGTIDKQTASGKFARHNAKFFERVTRSLNHEPFPHGKVDDLMLRTLYASEHIGFSLVHRDPQSALQHYEGRLLTFADVCKFEAMKYRPLIECVPVWKNTDFVHKCSWTHLKIEPLVYPRPPPNCLCKHPTIPFDQRAVIGGILGLDKNAELRIKDFLISKRGRGGEGIEPKALMVHQRELIFQEIVELDEASPLRRLIPGRMLDGAVVHAYRQWIMAEHTRACANVKKIHIFGTDLFGQVSMSRWKEQPRNVEIFSLEHLFFLCHFDGHFFLGHVNMRAETLRFYDSLWSPRHQTKRQSSYVPYDEFAKNIEYYLIERYKFTHQGKEIDLTHWMFNVIPETVEGFLQSDFSNDCGCFMLRATERLAFDKPLTRLGNMDDFRCHVYTVTQSKF